MIACANFTSNVSVEARAVVIDSSCWDVLFAVSCDDVGEMFGGSVDAGKGVQTESCKVVLYVRGEGGPVGSLVVCECTFGWGGCMDGEVCV